MSLDTRGDEIVTLENGKIFYKTGDTGAKDSVEFFCRDSPAIAKNFYNGNVVANDPIGFDRATPYCELNFYFSNPLHDQILLAGIFFSQGASSVETTHSRQPYSFFNLPGAPNDSEILSGAREWLATPILDSFGIRFDTDKQTLSSPILRGILCRLVKTVHDVKVILNQMFEVDFSVQARELLSKYPPWLGKQPWQ